MPLRRPSSAAGLAAVMGVGGISHFLVTDAYARIVPPALGHARGWVYVSGVAEVACGAGLLVPRTRRSAGLATAVLLVAVFPANVTMALHSRGRPVTYRAAVWSRLPLQVPLVLWALSIGRATRKH